MVMQHFYSHKVQMWCGSVGECVSVWPQETLRVDAWTLMWHGTVLTDTDQYPLMLRQRSGITNQHISADISPYHSCYAHKTLNSEKNSICIKAQNYIIYKLRAYRTGVLTSCDMIGQFWWVTAHRPIKTRQSVVPFKSTFSLFLY